MPRPAPKRNRTKPADPAPAAETQNDDTTAKSPEHGSALDPRQALRSQTPMTTSYEQAIESSPTSVHLISLIGSSFGGMFGCLSTLEDSLAGGFSPFVSQHAI